VPWELYSTQAPARPVRGIIGAAVLLAISAALAAGLCRTRSAGGLGHRFRPENWDISFQPPRSFGAGEPLVVAEGMALPYIGRGPSGRPLVLVAYRLDGPAADSSVEVCARALALVSDHRGAGLSMLGFPGLTSPARLGPLRGVEFRESDGAVAVRAALRDRDTGYALAIAAVEGLLDDDAYRLFDQVCASVQRDGE
jgi:hypothetical protein